MIDGNVVMAPADWGNSSIAYRTDLVSEAEGETWNIFFDDKYSGKVAFTDSEVAVEIAGLMLGYSPQKIWEMSDEELAATKPLVQKLVKNCRFIWSDPTELNQALASGEIVAGYAWNETVKTLGAERAVEIRRAEGRHLHLALRHDLAQRRQGRSRPPPMISSMPGSRRRPAST